MGNNNNYERLTKHFVVGEYDFTIALNRKMAVGFMKVQPKFFDGIQRLSKSEKELANRKPEDVTFEELASRLDLMSELEDYAAEIVDYALPKMLEFGELGVDVDYNDYAAKIIEFCKENEILYSEIYEESGELVKGFYMLVMDFITMGFMYGRGMPKNKMPKIRIITD